ncbi:hypothetical protein ABWI00_21545 [Algihabitans albus]|uniref:hypothetical protein n=1 Tax=Algihabitans albus TaxID=2164067 RepID=UPI0035CED670
MLAPDEQRALRDSADRFHVRLFILIALNSGVCHGMILDLTWNRVGADCEWVDVRHPAKRQTKTRRTAIRCWTLASTRPAATSSNDLASRSSAFTGPSRALPRLLACPGVHRTSSSTRPLATCFP